VDADGSVTSITVTNAKEGEVLYVSLDNEDDAPVKLKLRMSGDHVFANFDESDCNATTEAANGYARRFKGQ
jgi:hypothetical protein